MNVIKQNIENICFELILNFGSSIYTINKGVIVKKKNFNYHVLLFVVII